MDTLYSIRTFFKLSGNSSANNELVAKTFCICKKILGSNATLLSRFFWLCPPIPCASFMNADDDIRVVGRHWKCQGGYLLCDPYQSNANQMPWPKVTGPLSHFALTERLPTSATLVLCRSANMPLCPYEKLNYKGGTRLRSPLVLFSASLMKGFTRTKGPVFFGFCRKYLLPPFPHLDNLCNFFWTPSWILNPPPPYIFRLSTESTLTNCP